MPSGIEGSRAAFRAEFAGGMRKIIKESTTMTDDVKIKIFSILFGYEKPKPSKLKWKKLKEKYPDYAEQLMSIYNKTYPNPVSITMDNYHEDELLLEKIRKLSGPEGEIAMLESKKLKLQHKIDKINNAIEEVREKKN